MKFSTDHMRSAAIALSLTIVLAGLHAATAATISGTVKNEAAAALANVDLDFIDACSGDNIFLASDKTAADGTYSVVIPNGTYDVHYTPPAGSTVCAADVQSLVVSANANLGITTLHPGRLVSGTVQTPALAAAAGIDLKFVNTATNHRIYLSKDVTNAAGQYALRVPPGTYDIDFRPPAASTFTDKERLGLVVGASDISGLVDALGSGFTVTGILKDKNNNLLKNVDIDVFDQCTGKTLATAHDNTDINGAYSVCVPAGTYTFNYDAPQCRAVEALRSPNTVITASTNLGTDTMKNAVLVTGIVRNHLGLPLADAKIKFYDATVASLPRQAAANDRTTATGGFSIYVPTGTYNLNVEPPVGVNDQVGQRDNIDIGAAVNVGIIQLVAGIPVSGHVAKPGNLPALGVNINIVDSVTRAKQIIAHDATDAAGNFTVVVAPGTYDFQYDPPACSGLAPTSQNNRVIAATTALPTLNLVAGVHVLGSAFDTHALPVHNVDLDFYLTGSSTKIYTPNDQTAVDGSYDVIVPPGSYDIKYIPPSLTRLRPVARLATSLLVSQTLPTTLFPDGWLVSGFVRDAFTLAPIAGVTVDFYVRGTSTPAWTIHHLTSATGAYSVSIPAGTWDILYTPAPGSPYAPPPGTAYATHWRRGIVVAADLPLTDILLSPPTAAETHLGPAGAAQLATWPNPARGKLRIAFAAPGAGDAELTAWDVAGHRVATLWHGRADANVLVQWNGTGTNGAVLPAGIYYVRLVDRAGTSLIRRVTLLH